METEVTLLGLTFVDCIYFSFFIFGIILALQGAYLVRGLRKTPSLSGESKRSGPMISVIIAGRNEEAHIGETLQSLLGQDYKNFEVIFLDDRSEDQTFEKAKRFISENLSVDQIKELPKGWLGKNHALWTGAKKAQGDWLLFTDADVRFDPTTLSRVAHFIQRHNVDHLTLHPKVTARSSLLEDCLIYFQMLFFQRFRPWAIPDKKKAFAGIGAFNFLKKETYFKMGGHSVISLRPEDDLMLGRLVKSSGYRSIYLFGLDAIQVEWYPDVKALIKGLEKNTFAGCQYKVSVAVLIGSLLFFTQLVPLLMIPVFWVLYILNSDPSSFEFLISSGMIYHLGLFLFAICYMQFSKKLGVRWWSFFLSPLAMSILIYVLAHASKKTIQDGGIRWRDTFTSLKELKSQKEPPLG